MSGNQPPRPGMGLRRAGEIAREVEAANGKPPLGSLSALLRADYELSQSLEHVDPNTVQVDIVTFAKRTMHADWIVKQHGKMDRALLQIALATMHDPAMREIYDLAHDTMTRETRDRLRAERLKAGTP